MITRTKLAASLILSLTTVFAFGGSATADEPAPGSGDGLRTLTCTAPSESAEGIPVNPGQPFVVRSQPGFAKPGRLIAIRAEPRRVRAKGQRPKARRIAIVRTGRQGWFRTKRLKLYPPAGWVLTATPVDRSGPRESPPGAESAASCNGVVSIRRFPHAPAIGELTGHNYRSVKVNGRRLGRARVNLRFYMARGPWMSRKGKVRPYLNANVGCNSMIGRFGLRHGVLRWRGDAISTAMMCFPFHDVWLDSLIRRGMKASLFGRTLTLVRGRNRIVLRQTRR